VPSFEHCRHGISFCPVCAETEAEGVTRCLLTREARKDGVRLRNEARGGHAVRREQDLLDHFTELHEQARKDLEKLRQLLARSAR